MLEALIIGFLGSLLASAVWHFIAKKLDRK
ncbi:hypothetical protein SAMN05444722_3083 [Rhodovulum sp. ES.010]|nr:hypothetical protein SAMN05444722_3083 [Rhodovulum sp. ES.010]